MEQNKQLQLVTFEQAKRLKKLGFNWDLTQCYDINGEYKNGIRYHWLNNETNGKAFPAPSVSLALKWYREVTNYKCFITYGFNEDCILLYCYAFTDDPDIAGTAQLITSNLYDTYDEAESALLDRLLKFDSINE